MRVGNHSRSIRTDERGMALAIALLAIVVIGALVTGTFFAGRMEMAAGRNSVYTAQATEAAEAGLATAFGATWNSSWNAYLLAYDAGTPTYTQTPVYPLQASRNNSSVRYTQTVRRLKAGVFEVTSVGEKLDRNGNVLATRMLAKLGKLYTVTIDIKAAVTADADVQVNGHTTKVDGHDQLPDGWVSECPAPAAGTGVYGIRTSAAVGTSGNPDIQGVPAATQINDATVTPALFLNPFNLLSPLANITLTSAGGTQNFHPGPTSTGSSCNTADLNNWGEPLRNGGFDPHCIDYYPIVYYPGPGTLALSTGRAQGIILSAGDIDIAGNFEFNGIMLAMGAINTHGTGNKVSGAVLAGNANINDDDTIAGTPTILYSSCAINMALKKSARGLALNERNWAQINPR
jgi:hypothetical protein